MGNLTDETIARLTGVTKKPEETVDGVKKQAQDMDVIDKAMETAKKLSGHDVLQQELTRKDAKLEKAEGERDKAIEGKNKAEIDSVRTELGNKIDNLAQAYTRGASKESIADQIAGIKKAATELNMGGSRISEIREMLSLVTTLNPQKSLADQIKDAKELITVFTPPPDKGKEFSIGGMPATVALELKKMDTNLQITLENMKDDRQRKDQEFQLTLKKWDEDRELRRSEIEGKLAADRERTKMVGDGLQMLGRAGGKAVADAAREGMAPGVARSPGPGAAAPQPTRSYHIDLAEAEGAQFECPHCKSPIAVGPTSIQARCLNCNAQFPITRQAASATPEPKPPEEE
jgi:molecular chaperone GrpE (heat shock protein)